jgi:hypothetical protein
MLLKGAPSNVVPQQLVNQGLHDKDRLKAESFRAMCYYIHIMHNNELENEMVDESERYRIMKRFDSDLTIMPCFNINISHCIV